MALLYWDGFDNIVAGDFGIKGWIEQYASWSASASYVRKSGSGAYNNGNGGMRRLVPASTTIIVGAAFYVQTPSTNNRYLITLSEGGTHHIALQWSLATNETYVTRGVPGTWLGTASKSYALNTWNYIELKVYIHNSAGTVTLRINEETVLSLTGQDTQNGGSGYVDLVEIGTVQMNGGYGPVMRVDDLYIADTTGSAPWNDFLGDVVVQTIFPTAESACAWTPLSGTDNSLMVDDTAQDGDTTYVTSNTATQQDLYTMGNLSANTLSVYGVQTCAVAKKDDAGTAAIKLLTKSGGTTDTGASNPLSTSYVFYTERNETDPNTSAQWAIAAVDAVETGVENV